MKLHNEFMCFFFYFRCQKLDSKTAATSLTRAERQWKRWNDLTRCCPLSKWDFNILCSWHKQCVIKWLARFVQIPRVLGFTRSYRKWKSINHMYFPFFECSSCIKIWSEYEEWARVTHVDVSHVFAYQLEQFQSKPIVCCSPFFL